MLVGLPVNIFALVVLNIATNTWAASAYDLFNLPEFFRYNTSASAFNVTTATVVNVMTLNSTLVP